MTDLDLEFQPGQAWRLANVPIDKAVRSTDAANDWSPRRRLAIFLLCALGSWAVALTPLLVYWYV